MDTLLVSNQWPIQAEHAGLFISREFGTHPDRSLPCYELFLVRSGTLHIEEAGSEFAVQKDEALILWPNRRHRGTKPYGKDLSFYWIHFQVQANVLTEPIPIPQYSKPLRITRLTELFHRYLDDQESSLSSPEENNLLVALMLLELRRSTPEISSGVHSLADRAARFIEGNFHRGIHAGDVAKVLGCNLDYLGSAYRRAFGCTISHAIHRKQIEEARVQLRESNKNIEEIAAACGFNESRYFRKLFTQHHGISPREYRKLYARQL